jgi:hypothetical protein
MRFRMSFAISLSYSTALFLAVISTFVVESDVRLSSAVTSYSPFVPIIFRCRPLSSGATPCFGDGSLLKRCGGTVEYLVYGAGYDRRRAAVGVSDGARGAGTSGHEKAAAQGQWGRGENKAQCEATRLHGSS